MDPQALIAQLRSEKKALHQNSQAFLRQCKQQPSIDSRQVDWIVAAEYPFCRLLQFTGSNKDETACTPILLCFALINSPHVLNISEDRSFIKALSQQGFIVYLIEWKEARIADYQCGIADYALGALRSCVNHLTALFSRKVHLAGICQGGTLACIYAAMHSQTIASLSLLSTPGDTHTPFDIVTRSANCLHKLLGNGAMTVVTHQSLSRFFLSLKPAQHKMTKYLDEKNILGDNQDFTAMESWIYSGPNVSSRFLWEYIELFYRKNVLLKGVFRLGPYEIDLKSIGCPILNVFGTYDHIVPAQSSNAIRRVFHSYQYREMAVSSGHIGMFVNKISTQKVVGELKKWLD